MDIVGTYGLGRLDGKVTLMIGVGRLSEPQELPSGTALEFLLIVS